MFEISVVAKNQNFTIKHVETPLPLNVSLYYINQLRLKDILQLSQPVNSLTQVTGINILLNMANGPWA